MVELWHKGPNPKLQNYFMETSNALVVLVFKWTQLGKEGVRDCWCFYFVCKAVSWLGTGEEKPDFPFKVWFRIQGSGIDGAVIVTVF